MSEDRTSILGVSRKIQLSGEVTLLMLKGAAYALIAVLALWATIAFFQLVGWLLPPESQNAADPSPWSALEIVTDEVIV